MTASAAQNESKNKVRREATSAADKLAPRKTRVDKEKREAALQSHWARESSRPLGTVAAAKAKPRCGAAHTQVVDGARFTTIVGRGPDFNIRPYHLVVDDVY